MSERSRFDGGVAHINRYLKDEVEAIHAAAKTDVTMLELIIAKYSNVNLDARNWLELTPLMTAAMHGRTKVAQALIDGGASPFERDDTGWTAAHYAARFEHVEVLRVLQKVGAVPISSLWGMQETPEKMIEEFQKLLV